MSELKKRAKAGGGWELIKSLVGGAWRLCTTCCVTQQCYECGDCSWSNLSYMQLTKPTLTFADSDPEEADPAEPIEHAAYLFNQWNGRMDWLGDCDYGWTSEPFENSEGTWRVTVRYVHSSREVLAILWKYDPDGLVPSPEYTDGDWAALNTWLFLYSVDSPTTLDACHEFEWAWMTARTQSGSDGLIAEVMNNEPCGGDDEPAPCDCPENALEVYQLALEGKATTSTGLVRWSSQETEITRNDEMAGPCTWIGEVMVELLLGATWVEGVGFEGGTWTETQSWVYLTLISGEECYWRATLHHGGLDARKSTGGSPHGIYSDGVEVE